MRTEVEETFKSPTIRSPHAKAYWDGLRDHKLVVQKCNDCGAYTHPPGPICTSCLSPNKSHVTMSGHGTVYTYTITHRPMHSEFKEDVPYAIIYVKLEEGPMIVSWLTGVDPQGAKIGMPVEIAFEKIDENTTLHRFRPA